MTGRLQRAGKLDLSRRPNKALGRMLAGNPQEKAKGFKEKAAMWASLPGQGQQLPALNRLKQAGRQ